MAHLARDFAGGDAGAAFSSCIGTVQIQRVDARFEKGLAFGCAANHELRQSIDTPAQSFAGHC